MKSAIALRSTRCATFDANNRFFNRVSLALVMLLAVAVVLIYVDRSRAAGGDIDPTFNAGGAGPDNTVLAVAVQPDGKIVIGGQFVSYNGDAAASNDVMRVNANGMRDATFNAGGAGANGVVFAVAVQPDGKIIIGGSFTSYNGDAAASDTVMRLNADGTRDSTFNPGGAGAAFGAGGSVSAVAMQPDGKIVIGGTFTSYNGDSAVSSDVMRLNADGTRDPTFNAGGTGASSTVRTVAVQPDGKIVIGGNFSIYNGFSNRGVMRLNADGTRDATFNASGSGPNSDVVAVAVQPDGKIVIGGFFTSYNNDAAASDEVMRLNADGTRDPTFNAGGAGANNTVFAVGVQPDGKIVIGGDFTSYNGDAAASDKVMRLNSDGTPDPTFNAGGSGANNTVEAVAVQPDGKILIGGSFTSYNGDAAASDRVIRLLPAPGAVAFSAASYDVTETAGSATITVKRTGGTDNQVVGKVTLSDVTTSPADYRFTPGVRDAAFNAGGAGANSSVYVVAAQPDGKIVIGGLFSSYNSDAAASDNVMRLNSDGTRDPTFNAGGAGANGIVKAVAVQPDGKILIGGQFTSYNGNPAASHFVMRLNADGTRDPTFNASGAGANSSVTAVAVQPDGKIVIGGDFTSYNGDAAASDDVMRLNADGTRDATFNAGGAGADNSVTAVAVQPDGKIVIGGQFTSYNGDPAASDDVMRLNADGTRDPTFNAGGAGANSFVLAVAVQPDGKIVFGGDFTSYNGDLAASDKVMRLNSDGTRDATFNAGGAGANGDVNAAAAQPDGKIVIGGDFTSYNGDAAASDRVMRLKADGTRDATFNAGGVGANNSVFAVTVQPEGKIVIGGLFTTYNGDAAASHFIMRLDGDLFVTWPAGDATDKIILLPIVNDGVPEGNETLTLTLAVMSGGATLGSPSSSTLTIHDPNAPPAITANGPLTRQQGTAATNSQIASVTDDGGNDSVAVTVTSANPSNGVTITNIINTAGTVTANVAASCSASNAAFTLQASDGTLTATSTLSVTVTANTAPTLVYPSPPSVAFGGSTTVTPTTATDNGSISSYAVLSVVPALTTPPTVNSSGVVSITNAQPAGNHVITIRATDSCGAITDSSFTVNVSKGNQTITFNALASKTFGDADFTVSATASSNLSVSFAASGQCTVSGSTVHLTGAGSCTITASQAGDSNFNAATNVTQTFSIAKASSTTALSSSTNPSDLGQNVTFTATVTSGAGTPTGTVQFKIDGANAGAAMTLNGGGVATFATSTLTTGTRTITADYSGDTNFLTSTGTLPGGQVVEAQPSLSINDVSITEGDSGTNTLNFTVTLSAASSLTVTANYATANGTATAPSDYVAISTTALTFNPGDLTKTIGVTINGDTSFETNETFTVNLSSPVNATISTAQGTSTIFNDDAQGGFISFSQANYVVSESTGFVTLTVNRSNDVSGAATVDYATDDTGALAACATFNGFASSRCDFTTAIGTLKFAAGETQKTIVVPVNQDSYAEPAENFTVNLSNLTGGAAFALPATASVTINDSAAPAPNAGDDTDTFVRQQYHDFLNREPDAPGLAFWKDQVDNCTPKPQCTEVRRITVSAAFFLSIEFQQSGEFVRDFYVATLDRPLTNNMPNYPEFIRDTQAVQRGIIVGQGNWQADLDANRSVFMTDFVMRGEFAGWYPTTDTPTQYVNKLFVHAAVTPTLAEVSTAINEFGSATTASDPGARGRALLRVTQNAAFQQRELNRAFVHMQYLGYLRRNPNAAPDTDFSGYDFWLAKLIQFNGNFINAEMVKAFINSGEYRHRFGP